MMRRPLRKPLALFLSVVLTLTATSGTFAQQNAVGPPELGMIEQILYGRIQEGSLLDRLTRAERDVLGQVGTGAYLVRLQRLSQLLGGLEGEVPLKMKLNAVEWAMFQRVNEGASIGKRLDQMESAMFGEVRGNEGLVGRLDELLHLMWPGGRVYVSERDIPKSTLVHIELLTELSSETSKPNDPVRYRVVEDVRIDHQIVIPAGAEGQGHVISVDSAGRLGQDGRVQVDFGSTVAMDSTPVPIAIAERATAQNQSLELAAGASLAGVVLLGPIGLAAGYFVRGKPHVVSVGTKFYVEVARETRVRALSLVPTQATPYN